MPSLFSLTCIISVALLIAYDDDRSLVSMKEKHLKKPGGEVMHSTNEIR